MSTINLNNDGTIIPATDPSGTANQAKDNIVGGANPNDAVVYTKDDILAAADGPGGNAIPTIGTDSLFNPFYVFRYAKFSNQSSAENPGKYDATMHKLKYDASIIGADVLQKKRRETIDNPTASVILKWAQENGSNTNGPLFPYPYQKNDFLWCKWYGKIPNNRMLTLRRYNIPVEDNLQIAAKKLPLVPVAQAVTWWGGETGNKLSEILNITYAYNWKAESEIKATVQDVNGNEVDAGKVLDALGATNENLRKVLLPMFFNNPNNPFQASGYDETLQQYVKDSWGPNGPYWNRVLGPINVIDSTKVRDRGFTFTHKMTIDFEYKLRSFGQINPKVAMLDLMSNFLSLTYSRAPFWGGAIRYFQKTGYTAIGLSNQAMEEGDYLQGLKDMLSSMGPAITSGIDELKGFVDKLSNDATKAGSAEAELKTIVDALGNSAVGRDVIASRLSNLHQTPLLMRSLLDGRAVGEWHLTVGNPMDPIAVIGNLCLTSSTMTMSDELGNDGFPTGIKFSVTLEHGRPRAKQDIQSMFNLGGGDLTFTKLAPPTSEYNSYGSYADERLKSANNETTNATSSATSNDNTTSSPEKAENLAAYFRASVGRAYGAGFANSGILTDYFTQLRTKD